MVDLTVLPRQAKVKGNRKLHRKLRDSHQVTWLHISDIHFSSNDEYNQSIVQGAFLRDLPTLCSQNQLHLDAIFVTGDIAFSGDAKEYEHASRFFDRLLSITFLSKDRLFIVPGNHDVNRRVNSNLTPSISAGLRNRDQVNALIASPSESAFVGQRMAPYVQFVTSYCGQEGVTFCNENPFYYVRPLNVRGKDIAVLGLNSAWLSVGDQDQGNLLVGERQVREAVNCSQGADVRIALLHHPINWLKDFDEIDSENLLNLECHFILRGHLHKSKLGFWSSPDSNSMQIAAGALYGTRNYPNAFNIVQFRTGAHKGVVYLWRYSDEEGGFFAPDTLSYRNVRAGKAKFAFSGRFSDPELSAQLSIDAFLATVSIRLVDQIGKKHTAYPTDMSFRELFDESVYVSPSFRSPSRVTTSAMNLEEVLHQINVGKSMLVIGDAGSGKSFFTYLVQRHISRSKSRIAPQRCIPIDLRVFIEAADNSDMHYTFEVILSTLWENYREEGYELSIATTHSSKILFVVDGIDELAGNPSHMTTTARLLDSLRDIGAILVTCRTRDYEYTFAPHLNLELFDLILEVREWEIDKEFAEFVRKLEQSNRFCDESFLNKVTRSTTLRALARRPLHARMLTFVSRSDVERVRDLSQLYADYLHKYAIVVDTSLLRQGCLSKPETLLLWRESAWHAFYSDLFVHDKIQLTALHEFLAKCHNVMPQCVIRLIEPLFNIVDVFHTTQIQFVHYSFFEYLVAEHMAQALVRNCQSDSVEIYAYFAKDMTLEIRHHLIAILNRTATRGFGKWLAQGYAAINDAAPSQVHREVANNLLVYILGRIGEDTSNEMWRLLKLETDGFLRTCLYWGLAAMEGPTAVREYMRVLETDAQMRSLNQGYLLYYYGDLDRSKDPPYLDNDPTIAWANTKLRTLEMMAAPDYRQRVRVGRRIIDLYTVYDFCIFRGERLRPGDERIVSNVLSDIEKDVNDPLIVKCLAEKHQQVIGQPRLFV